MLLSLQRKSTLVRARGGWLVDRASAGQLAKPFRQLGRRVFAFGFGDVRSVVSPLAALNDMRGLAQAHRDRRHVGGRAADDVEQGGFLGPVPPPVLMNGQRPAAMRIDLTRGGAVLPFSKAASRRGVRARHQTDALGERSRWPAVSRLCEAWRTGEAGPKRGRAGAPRLARHLARAWRRARCPTRLCRAMSCRCCLRGQTAPPRFAAAAG